MQCRALGLRSKLPLCRSFSLGMLFIAAGAGKSYEPQSKLLNLVILLFSSLPILIVIKGDTWSLDSSS